MPAEQFWIGVGLLGEALFGMRMLGQWIATERRKRSVVPLSFWALSVAGGVALLSYALYRRDPVFIVAETTGLAIYARNLYFIQRARRTDTGLGRAEDRHSTFGKFRGDD